MSDALRNGVEQIYEALDHRHGKQESLDAQEARTLFCHFPGDVPSSATKAALLDLASASTLKEDEFLESLLQGCCSVLLRPGSQDLDIAEVQCLLKPFTTTVNPVQLARIWQRVAPEGTIGVTGFASLLRELHKKMSFASPTFLRDVLIALRKLRNLPVGGPVTRTTTTRLTKAKMQSAAVSSGLLATVRQRAADATLSPHNPPLSRTSSNASSAHDSVKHGKTASDKGDAAATPVPTAPLNPLTTDLALAVDVLPVSSAPLAIERCDVGTCTTVASPHSTGCQTDDVIISNASPRREHAERLSAPASPHVDSQHDSSEANTVRSSILQTLSVIEAKNELLLEMRKKLYEQQVSKLDLLEATHLGSNDDGQQQGAVSPQIDLPPPRSDFNDQWETSQSAPTNEAMQAQIAIAPVRSSFPHCAGEGSGSGSSSVDYIEEIKRREAQVHRKQLAIERFKSLQRREEALREELASITSEGKSIAVACDFVKSQNPPTQVVLSEQPSTSARSTRWGAVDSKKNCTWAAARQLRSARDVHRLLTPRALAPVFASDATPGPHQQHQQQPNTQHESRGERGDFPCTPNDISDLGIEQSVEHILAYQWLPNCSRASR